MVSRTNYWKLGFFVVCGATIGLGALFWIGATRLTQESILAYAYFDETVSGLDQGSPVRYRGVSIGKVKEISLAPDRRHVQVTCELYTDSLERLGLRDADRPLTPEIDPFVPPDMRAMLVSSALTGLTHLNFDFVDPARHPLPEYDFPTPWNTVPTVRSTFKSFEAGVMEVLNDLPALAGSATQLAAQMDRAVEEARIGELSAAAQSLVQNVDEQVQALEASQLFDRGAKMIDGAESALVEVRAAAAEVRAAAAELRAREGPVYRAADRFDALGTRIEQALDDASVAQTFDALRRAGEKVADAAEVVVRLGTDAGADLQLLRHALRAVRDLADLLQRDPGALLHGRTLPPPPAERGG